MSLDPMAQMRAQQAAGIAAVIRHHGLRVPAELDEAVDVLAEAEQYEVPPAVALERQVDTARAEDIPKLIEQLADSLQRQPAMSEARRRSTVRAVRRVSTAARAAAPEVVALLAPAFLAVAEMFTGAYEKLPRGWADPDAILDAGPKAGTAWKEAQTAVADLDALRSVRDTLASLGARAEGNVTVEKGTRLVKVRDTIVAEAVADLLSRGSGRLGVWGEILATDGVLGLWWPSVDEHARYIAALPSNERTDGFAGPGLKVAVQR